MNPIIVESGEQMAHTCRAKKIINLHKSGMADGQSGDIDSAVGKLNMALRELRKIGLEGYQVKIMNNLGILFELRGDKQRAKDHYQAALAMAKHKLGNKAKLYQVVYKNMARVS
jgi:predicted negative regulator of RcsB-dependent stress response